MALPSLLLGPSTWALGRCYGLGVVAAALPAAAIAALVAVALARFTPAHLRTISLPHRWTRVAWLALVVVVAVEGARLSAFMAAPDRRHSVLPTSDFLARHSCATAYFEAARLLAAGGPADIIYQPRFGMPGSGPRPYGAFTLDNYEYTPAFLLIPRLMLPVAPDFPRFRALWNLLMMATILAGVALVLVWLPPEVGRRAALATPLLFFGIPTMTALQMGNVHTAMMAATVIALIAFERARPVLGGALLGYAILSKLTPGLLVVYLAVRRQWRAVLWTTVASTAWLLLAIAAFGIEPWKVFVLDHMPRLDSGAAFPQLRLSGPMLSNMSIPGLLWKLQAAGALATVPPTLVRLVGWLFTAVLVVLTVLSARAPLTQRLGRVALWLALLTLASLRSTFTPPLYGLFPVMWLATLLVAAPQRRIAIAAFVALVVSSTLLGWAHGTWPLPAAAALNGVAQLLSLLLPVLALRLVRQSP